MANDIMDKEEIKYKRILLKISGEVLLGERKSGIDSKFMEKLIDEIEEVHNLGVQQAIVIGGGNFYRGVNSKEIGIARATADYMGMLATVMNGLALQDAIEKKGIQTRLISALEIRQVAEPFIRRRAIRHLEKGRIVIFASGTGNPFFTTDTAAALRAIEIGADVILKATKVDGVYNKDPMKHMDAVKFESISHFSVLNKGLKVMDSTAISLCMDNKMPIIVFSLKERGNLKKIVLGHQIGTIVK